MRNPSSVFRQAALVAALGLAPALSAQEATAPAAPAPDKTVTLDPFDVSASPDKGYGELNSNSITAFKTELDKTPVSADVFDSKFLHDTGFTSVEETLQFFSAGAGNYSSAPDSSAANSQYLDRNSNGSLSLRGLTSPTLMVNGFFSVSFNGTGITGNGFTSPYDLEKIEVINGPQALLYGVSGAGGVVNLTTKQARLSVPAFGSFEFQLDQWGHKLGQLDYGMGTDKVAVRVALIDQTIGANRVYIGGPMEGAYVQLAVQPVKNTTIRLSYDNETFNRIASPGSVTLTAASTSNDARNGQNLNWLLATGQLNASATGASGAGAIPGINWDTVDSLAGDFSGEYRHTQVALLTIDTTWNSWLSTQIAGGYLNVTDIKYGNSTIAYDAPNVTTNPTGTFAVVLNSQANSTLWEPDRQKTGRISAFANNELFGGAVHSQTIVGTDYSRNDGATIGEFYVQADQNWNPIITNSATNNGYTLMPTQYFGVPNGPVQQALFNPYNPRITYNGVNYVRAITNGTSPALVSPSNQEGLTGDDTTGDYRHATDILSGVYAANYSDYFDGKLSTLLGFRVGNIYERSFKEGTAVTLSTLTEGGASFRAFNAGFNFQIVPGLRFYAELSDDANPEIAQNTVLGEESTLTKAFGQEIGFKGTLAKWNLSGQLAIFHATSHNELYSFTSTLLADINPTGLNGSYNNGSSKTLVDRSTQGTQLTATAAPGDWRLRLSAAFINAKVQSNASYAQLYNDQFNENAAGDVTYADGTIVYVNPTYNAKGVIAAPQTTAPAGYVPLTLAMMNNPSSPYYANPQPINSQIPSTANVYTVLQQTDPAHGKILTGATGLPISMLQIAPNPASPPPGNIVVTEAGDVVAGYPRYSLNFIGLYTIPTGWFKGVRLGGDGTLNWKNSLYYFYPQGVGVLNNRIMLYDPTEALFTGIIGYERKFKRITFSTQININNIFNHYHLILLPNSATGWAGPNNATLDQLPRNYVWTTTIGF